jgi:hypothetical protein
MAAFARTKRLEKLAWLMDIACDFVVFRGDRLTSYTAETGGRLKSSTACFLVIDFV